MTVDWRHRIVRVPSGDEEQLRSAVLGAVAEGWIYVCGEPADGMVDLVFRRARPRQPRIVWS